jgi:hypothetical protein
MKNVQMKIDKNVLTIQVDLSKNFGASKTGKSIIIASTEGNVSVGTDDIKLGLNIYKSAASLMLAAG